ncbi:MAG: hypothetical protein LBK73_04780 [Treponema sp.]|jgi:colicin import membrane protein|nr:hypothetical protein [Treponema sp.]
MKKTFQMSLMVAVIAVAMSCASKPVPAPEPSVPEAWEQPVDEKPALEPEPELPAPEPEPPVGEADLAPDQAALDALAAAKAGADAAREQARAVGGDEAYPDDWGRAEETYREAEASPRDTRGQAREAVARYKAAADKYGAVHVAVLRSRADESRALADSARREALDVKANAAVRDDYNAADALYSQSADSYKAGSFEAASEGYARTAELFVAARDAAIEKRAVADENRALADSARQEALDVKANVAARGDYNTADALYSQSADSYKAGSFEEAAEDYAVTAELFVAARDMAIEKRAAADAAIKAAEEKAGESDALAQNSVRILGGNQE